LCQHLLDLAEQYERVAERVEKPRIEDAA
jgi:hypothetical protein